MKKNKLKLKPETIEQMIKDGLKKPDILKKYFDIGYSVAAAGLMYDRVMRKIKIKGEKDAAFRV